MPKRRSFDELDDAVEALLADAQAPPPNLPADAAALVRIAAELRGLPSAAFKTRLRHELLSAAAGTDAAANAGPPLLTMADIDARLAELAAGPSFAAQDLRAALTDLPEMTMRFLASLNQCTLGVSRFSTGSHWERHPAADELLHVLEGEVDITTLTDDGPVESFVSAGSVFICPRGLWHRLTPRSPVSLFFATPGEGTEHSAAKVPRRRSTPGRRGGQRRRAPRPEKTGYDIRAALNSVPKLTITAQTTHAEADAAFRQLVTFNKCGLFVGRFSGQSPWERHSGGDELLHILDGEVDVTVLTDGGPVHRTVRGGSIFVCPQGLWHRQNAPRGVTALYATPTPSQISFAEDPRAEG